MCSWKWSLTAMVAVGLSLAVVVGIQTGVQGMPVVEVPCDWKDMAAEKQYLEARVKELESQLDEIYDWIGELGFEEP